MAIVIGGGYYLLKNKASNDTGTTTTSKPTTSTSKPDAPVVETGASSFVSSSTVVVNGKVKPNGASTSYWFEYGETTGLGNRTVSQQVGSGYTSTPTPAYITGLRANTVYYFRLSAKNSLGTVNGGTLTFKTNNNPPLPGLAPTTSTSSASNVSRTAANVNGSVNPNGWQTSYWFEYGKDNNLGFVTAFQSAGNGNSSINVSMSLSGLEAQTRYYFRLNAQNQYGTINGAILNFTTNGPAYPSAPSVTTTSASNITTSGAKLNGRVNPNGADTNYWFEYSQDSLLGTLIGNGSPIQTLNAGDSSVNVEQNITGLAKNTRYYYHLVGRNSYGTVTGSIVSFKTQN